MIFSYKRRQAIVEPPYGTLKRQWGFSYILTKKGIDSASSDVGLMFIAYNLRRIGNILTMKVLKEYLKILVTSFFELFDRPGRYLMISGESFLAKIILPKENSEWLKRAFNW